MTKSRMGEPVRRLRPLLPEQAASTIDTNETVFTDVGCRLLDANACRCTDYAHRQAKVQDCVRLTSRNVAG